MDTSDTRPPLRPGAALALLAFAQFVVALDYNIVYVALPDIGRELGFTAQSLQWVVSAYAVGFGGFLLFGGRIVDRFGARRTFVLGLALFGLSCLAGGFAGSPEALVAARGIQGLGGALLTPATLALINTGFAEGAERNRALSVWGAAGSGGLAAGALLGGVVTKIVRKYFEAWNDVNGDRRRTTIEAIFTDDAEIIDPDWTAEGRDAVVSAIGQSREKLGDLVLGLTHLISTHNNVALYSWHLGEQAAPVATGYGVLALEKDRIRQAYNFFG